MKGRPFWSKLTKLAFPKYSLEDAVSPLAFVGKSVVAHKASPDGPEEKVVIKDILGSRQWPKYFEINGAYLVHAFSFFSQVMDNRMPAKEEMDEFELATQITQIKEIGDKNGTPKGKQEQAEGIGFKREFTAIEPGTDPGPGPDAA